MNSSGTYTRSGDTLTLTGTSVSYSDDGYRKGTDKDTLTMKLKYADSMLTILDNQDSDLVLRRKGDHAPLKQKPLPRPSDPKAVQIIHEMQRRYATLNSYSDEGTLTSSGRGFMAENAKFQTRFVRPHKFRFQVIELADGKELGRNVVWSDGKKTWLYTFDYGGPGGSEERGLGNALSTISPTSGYETMLVPALLFPAEFGESEIDAFYEEISLTGEEKVSGKDCYVISMFNPGGMDLKLWVDKSSYLIMRTFDRRLNSTTIYQPMRAIRLAES
jgi:outer membrane lipoprotein-sorting protein